MKDKNDRLHTEQDEIAKVFVEYYEELLGRKERYRSNAWPSVMRYGCMLSINHQMESVRSYSGKEVAQAMFSINNTKSPGPGGYGSEFFKVAWNVIGQDVTIVILEYFENGKLLQHLNTTIISLISKVPAPQYAS